MFQVCIKYLLLTEVASLAAAFSVRNIGGGRNTEDNYNYFCYMEVELVICFSRLSLEINSTLVQYNE